MPAAQDVLDAERVDQLLAVVNHRFAAKHALPKELRHAISDLAIEQASSKSADPATSGA
jgi:hypothetical protein